MEIPEHLELDVSGMAIGDTLRLVDLPAQEGVKFLDDPEETVLATVTMPTRFVEPEPKRSRARSSKRASCPRARSPRARRVAEGEAAAEGEAQRLRRARAPPRTRCASSVGARRPRRSTCSSRASATRAASTRARATTSAGWSSTSWRAGTAAPGARSSPGSLAEVRLGDLRLALLKPETYMNESGRSVGAAARFFKVEPEQAARRPRRRRPRARAGCRRGPAAASPGTTACARSRRHLGTQDFLRLRIGVGRPGPRRPAPGRRLGALAVRAGGRRRGARRPRPRTRSRRSPREGLEAAQQPLQLTLGTLRRAHSQ